MKISTKGRYGLRAMVDLAINSKGEKVILKQIAERQNISEPYLEQVFSTLRKAGIVNSQKGAQGGYSIAKDISNITVADILIALEGELFAIGDADNILEEKIRELVWQSISESINKCVEKITLEQLVTECKKAIELKTPMFYI